MSGETLRKLYEAYLRNTKLQGVEGIRKAFIRQVGSRGVGSFACMECP